VPRRTCKVDANQEEIVKMLRSLGADVIPTHQVGQYIPGFPDLLIGYRGFCILLEVKDGKAKLTADEKAFHQKHHKFPIFTVRTQAQAWEVLLEYVRGKSVL